VSFRAQIAMGEESRRKTASTVEVDPSTASRAPDDLHHWTQYVVEERLAGTQSG